MLWIFLKQIMIFVPVVPPRDLKVDHLKETSFSLHWTKAEGMEKVPQRFLISYCSPGTDLHAENTEDCHTSFSNLQPGTEYTVSVSTVLKNGEQSEPVSTTICTSKRSTSPCYSSIPVIRTDMLLHYKSTMVVTSVFNLFLPKSKAITDMFIPGLILLFPTVIYF
jgi:hypothetical protein